MKGKKLVGVTVTLLAAIVTIVHVLQYRFAVLTLTGTSSRSRGATNMAQADRCPCGTPVQRRDLQSTDLEISYVQQSPRYTVNKWSAALLAVLCVLLTACLNPADLERLGPLHLAIVSGNSQSGLPGTELLNPLVVKVEDAKGKGVRGQIVNFRVTEGGGSVFAGVAITNKDGVAQERWTLGESGSQQVEARAVDTETGEALTFAVFIATVLPPPDGDGPVSSSVVATPDPARTVDAVVVTGVVDDASTGGSVITGAEYNVDGGEFTLMEAQDGVFDQVTEGVETTIPAFGTEGAFRVCVQGTDAVGNTGAQACITVVISDGLKWDVMEVPTSVDLSAIWGASETDIYTAGYDAVGNNAVLHFDGELWKPVDPQPDKEIMDLWGFSSNNVYGVAGPKIMHYGGVRWAELPDVHFVEGLAAIWGSSPDDIFAVGNQGVIVHYDGHEWKYMDSPSTAYLHSVWGYASDDVYVVGVSAETGQGEALHYDGMTWRIMGYPSPAGLLDVWGVSKDDVFAVGDIGLIYRFDGNDWHRMTQVFGHHFNGVWGASPRDVIAVGQDGGLPAGRGRIFQFDGEVWKSIMEEPIPGLNEIWGTALGDVFVVGNGGAILRGRR